MSGQAMRERFSDTAEELMTQLRRQRVSHNTLARVETYLGAIMREHRAALSGATAPLDELSVMADTLDYSMGPERRRRLAADVLVKLTNAGYRIVRLPASPDPAQWDRTDPRGEGNPDNFDGSQS